jgi:hypothetical protein
MNTLNVKHTLKNKIKYSNISNNFQDGGKIRVKKLFKKIFRRTKKNKKAVELKDPEAKYTIKKVISHNSLTEKIDITEFINYILYYNINKPTPPSNNIKHIIINIDEYNNDYYKVYNDNLNDRKYKFLPSIKYMSNMYKKINNIKVFLTKIFEYLCIISIFENIIHNALYSNISNVFIVSNSNYVKYGLNIYNNDNIEEYLSEHNPIFDKLFNCRISLKELNFKQKTPSIKKKEIPLEIAEESEPVDPKYVPNIPVNNSLYNAFMYIPNVYETNKKPAEEVSRKSIKQKGGNNINIDELYLKLINKKIIISDIHKIQNKITEFYKNDITNIGW